MRLEFFVGARINLNSVPGIPYVYQWRGSTQCAKWSQYLRKGWSWFVPSNCVLYVTSHDSANLSGTTSQRVSKLWMLRENWKVIRDEALNLQATGAFDTITLADTVGSCEIDFRMIFRRDCSNLYFTRYGTTRLSDHCIFPQTIALLKQIPEVKSAMISIMPMGAGSCLHMETMVWALRYQSGIKITQNGQCTILVEGIPSAWYDVRTIIFDDPYPYQHPYHPHNPPGAPRVILFLEIELPLNFSKGLLNRVYWFPSKEKPKITRSDKEQSPCSVRFATYSRIHEYLLELKHRRRGLYQVSKWIIHLLMLSLSLILLSVVVLLLIYDVFSSHVLLLN